MSLDAASQQNLLRVELGLDAYPDIRATIPDVWKLYGEKSYTPRLQYLYAKAHLLEIRLQTAAGKVDWKEADVSQSDSQQYKNLSAMFDTTVKAIQQLEGVAGMSSFVKSGQITTVAPGQIRSGVTEPVMVDPMDGRILGSPLERNPIL